MAGLEPARPSRMMGPQKGRAALKELRALNIDDAAAFDPARAETEDLKSAPRDASLPAGEGEGQTDTLDMDERPVARRNHERHDVRDQKIRVLLKYLDKEKRGAGVVQDVSLAGLWVECNQPFVFRQKLAVHVQLPSGEARIFPGVVTRTNAEGMGISWPTKQTGSLKFRHSLVTAAVNGEALKLAVKALNDAEYRSLAMDQEVLSELYELWACVLADVHDHDRHETFINRCLKKERLPFALERYRDAQKTHKNAPWVQTRIEQLGKIITFSGFSRPLEKPEQNGRTRRVVMWTMLLLIGLSTMWFMAHRLSKTAESKAAPEASRWER